MTHLTKSCYVVLGLISKDPSSGYRLKTILAKIGRFYWSESNAQIYPILKKLESAELLTSVLDESSGARKKRIYTITEKGQKILEEWLHRSTEVTPYREEILLKLAFSQYVQDSNVLEMLAQYKLDIEVQIKDNNIVTDHLEDDHAGKPDEPYLYMIHDHVKLLLQAKLDWVNMMIERVKGNKTA